MQEAITRSMRRFTALSAIESVDEVDEKERERERERERENLKMKVVQPGLTDSRGWR